MSEAGQSTQPVWLRILRSPLVRLIVLGPALFFMMMKNNEFMSIFKDRPLTAIGITVCMALAALAVYYAYGRIIERREVTELSTPGMGREWATGALIGAGLITGCVLILLGLGMYRIEGLNPASFMIPALAMAISAGTFEELFFRGVIFKSVKKRAIFPSMSWLSGQYFSTTRNSSTYSSTDKPEAACLSHSSSMVMPKSWRRCTIWAALRSGS